MGGRGSATSSRIAHGTAQVKGTVTEKSIALQALSALPKEPNPYYGQDVFFSDTGFTSTGGKIIGVKQTTEQLHVMSHEETVPLDKTIKRTQAQVSVKGIEANLDGKGYSEGKKPLLYRTSDGNLHVAEGHTRLMVEYLKGKKTAAVDVVNLDEHYRPIKPRRGK